MEKKTKNKVRHQNQICTIAIREQVELFINCSKDMRPRLTKSHLFYNNHHYAVLVFHDFFCVRDTNGTYCLMHKYVLWLDVFNIWNWSILLLKIFEIDILTINVK